MHVFGSTLPPGLYIRFSKLKPRQDAGSIAPEPAAPVSPGFIVGVVIVGVVIVGFDVSVVEGFVVGLVIVPVVGVVDGVIDVGVVIAPGPVVVVGAAVPAAPSPGSEGAALSPQAAASRKGSSVIIRRVISSLHPRTAGPLAQRATEHLGYSATS
jgi:hypothetical protein